MLLLALISLPKPILMVAIFVGWGKAISFFDKDLQKLALQRQLWNAGQMAAGIVALLAVLFIPWFILGFILALLLLYSPIVAYVVYRNTKVAEPLRWDPKTILDALQGKVKDQQEKGAMSRAKVLILNEGGMPKQPPVHGDPNYAAHELFERVLGFALPRNAETVEVQVNAEQVAVVTTIDGVKFPNAWGSNDAGDAPQQAPTPQDGLKFINYVKENAKLDVQEQRRLQTGRLKVEDDEGQSFVGVETSGSTRGLHMVLRPNPDKQTGVKFDQLGLLKSQETHLVAALDDVGRVFIVSCPSGQGMTTTLYSLTDRHDPYTQSVVTMEDSVPFEMEGVQHTTIDADMGGQEIAKKLAGVVRRDPQVLMISKVRHNEVAKVVAEAAEEVRFYFGMDVPDTFTALRAWCKAVGDLKIASDALGGILSPRLFRKLCPVCKSPYQPDPQMLRKLNLPASKVGQLYKPSGKVIIRDKEEMCKHCYGLGYRGRGAVFEAMILDDDARDMIAAGELDQLRAHLRKNQMLYLQEAALAKVVEGTTSIGEVTRLFQQGK